MLVAQKNLFFFFIYKFILIFFFCILFNNKNTILRNFFFFFFIVLALKFMKAIILISETEKNLELSLLGTIPKSLVDFCNKPILRYHFEALKKIKVKQIILIHEGKSSSIFLEFVSSLEKEVSF